MDNIQQAGLFKCAVENIYHDAETLPYIDPCIGHLFSDKSRLNGTVKTVKVTFRKFRINPDGSDIDRPVCVNDGFRFGLNGPLYSHIPRFASAVFITGLRDLIVAFNVEVSHEIRREYKEL